MHYYVPWWKFDRKNDFPRGYHIELWAVATCRRGNVRWSLHDEEGYGVQLKRRARQVYGTTVGFSGRGEMIPNAETFANSTPTKWTSGDSSASFHFKWSEYELRQAKDMQETFKSIIEMMGGTYKTKHGSPGNIHSEFWPAAKSFTKLEPREWARIQKTSVLNGYCQTHDVKNVFVTDGAPLVTNPDKNPTLTIMALPGARLNIYSKKRRRAACSASANGKQLGERT